jgi:low temperature requirement protein LtrA
MSEEQAAANTPLESFFDLAYVLAFTQVTEFLSRHLDWMGLLQGLGLLAALWWAWACYSWLTDAAPAHERIPARLLILSAVAALTVASLALRDAFGRTAVLFAFAYLAVRLLHVVLYVMTTDDDPEARRGILRLVPGLLAGPALLAAASFAGGPVRAGLWAAALLIDYATPLARGVKGMKVHARHFGERYGLVIILALGESIATMGDVYPETRALVLVAVLLGVVLSAALWWAYFDYASQAAQNRLERAKGEDRARLARDAYSYAHLAMVAGIVFIALGVKTTVSGVERPLGIIPATALCGGLAVYLVGLNALRLRLTGKVRVARFVAAALACTVLAVLEALPRVSSVAALGIVAAIAVGLVTYETLWPDEFRQEVREDS